MDVLTYIKQYIKQHHRSPAYRDISKACHIASTAGVKLAVDALIEAGEIIRAPGGRGLRLAGCDVETLKSGKSHIGVCFTCRKIYTTDAASRLAEWIKNHKESE